MLVVVVSENPRFFPVIVNEFLESDEQRVYLF